MKILLIDDDAFLRDMYATKFTESGHEVEVADSARVALLLLERNQDFDVILMDMVMPGMSGTELIKELNSRFSDLRAKLIVLSNQGEPEDIKEATKAGADGYIIKAETIPTEVLKKIENISK